MLHINEINNKIQKVRTADIVATLEEKASRSHDVIWSMQELFEAIKSGKYFLCDNSKTQLYQKLGLPVNMMARIEKCGNANLKSELIREMMKYYDSNEGKIFVRMEKLNHPEKGQIEKVRAILSDNYVKIDNLPVISSLSKGLGDEILVRSWVNDDNSMRLEVIIDDRFELGMHDGKPDVFFPSLSFQNSETGNSSFNILYGLYRQFCSNGCVSLHKSLGNENIRHIGKDKNVIIDRMEDYNLHQIADKSKGMIDMFKNAKGIYVAKLEDEVEYIGEESDLPKKIIEGAKRLADFKYREKNLFDAFGAITESIHTSSDASVHVRMDREKVATKVFNERLSDYASGKVKVVEAIVRQ